MKVKNLKLTAKLAIMISLIIMFTSSVYAFSPTIIAKKGLGIKDAQVVLPPYEPIPGIYLNVINGNLVIQKKDAWVDWDGPQLYLGRTYNSVPSGVDGNPGASGKFNPNFGDRWRASYDVDFYESQNKDTIIVEYGDCAREIFTKADDRWIRNEGEYIELFIKEHTEDSIWLENPITGWRQYLELPVIDYYHNLHVIDNVGNSTKTVLGNYGELVSWLVNDWDQQIDIYYGDNNNVDYITPSGCGFYFRSYKYFEKNEKRYLTTAGEGFYWDGYVRYDTFEYNGTGDRLSKITHFPMQNSIIIDYDVLGRVKKMSVEQSGKTEVCAYYVYDANKVTEYIPDFNGIGKNVYYVDKDNGRITKLEIWQLIGACEGTPIPLGQQNQNNQALGQEPFKEYELIKEIKWGYNEYGLVDTIWADSSRIVKLRNDYRQVTESKFYGDPVRYPNTCRTTTYYYNNETHDLQAIKDPGGDSTYIQWFQNHMPEKVINPLGYDAYFTWEQGQLTTLQPLYGDWKYYEYFGEPKKYLKALKLGDIIKFRFDVITDWGAPTTITDAMGNITKIKYDSEYRKPLCKINAKGQETFYYWDEFNRLRAVVKFDDYDNHYANGEYGDYQLYWGTGNKIPSHIIQLMGDDNVKNLVNTYTYDIFGRLKCNTIWGSRAVYQQYTTHYTYYPTGQVKTITDPRGCYINFDGDVILEPGWENYTTSYIYDATGRRTHIVNGAGDTTCFHYDGSGDLVKTTDPRGLSIEYNYDEFHQVIKTDHPEKGTFQYVYDAEGDLEYYRDNNLNCWLHFERDSLDRIIQEWTYQGTPGEGYNDELKVSYKYDDYETGNPDNYVNEPKGELTEITYNESSSASYKYIYYYTNHHLLGKKETFYPGLDPFEIIYQYNDADLLETLVYPNGMELCLSYEELNRINNINVDGQLQSTFMYDPLGGWLFQDMNLKSNLDAAYSFNNIGLMEGIGIAKVLGEVSYDLYSANYREYDKVGNLLEWWDTWGGQGNSVEYMYQSDEDKQHPNWLFEEKYLEDKLRYNYKYDKVGNRIARKMFVNEQEEESVTYSYCDNSNRLQGFERKEGTSTVETIEYEYSLSGNLQWRQRILAGYTETINLDYDYRGRLIHLKKSTQGTFGQKEVNYHYDPLGNKVIRKENLQPNKYYFYEGNRVIAEFENGEWTNYIYGPGCVRKITNSNAYWLFKDRLGSTVLIVNDTDDEHIAEANYNYYAFGEIRKQFGPGSNYLFTGKELDKEIGLYDYGARWYDPEIGRFISPDPIENGNAYAYCDNNPVNRIDPSGMVSLKLPIDPETFNQGRYNEPPDLWEIAHRIRREAEKEAERARREAQKEAERLRREVAERNLRGVGDCPPGMDEEHSPDDDPLHRLAECGDNYCEPWGPNSGPSPDEIKSDKDKAAWAEQKMREAMSSPYYDDSFIDLYNPYVPPFGPNFEKYYFYKQMHDFFLYGGGDGEA